ncbi:MAG: site-specific DNA-methyltransferase, partial [Schwartzia sp.]|nr:site-specific DNA-methyltransferase [Schwartzia sp. (in: firmicutes)]
MEETNQLNFEGKHPRAKRYLNEVQLGQPPDTIMKEEKVGFNSEGTKLLAEILGNDKVFSQPKPSKLIEYLISILPNNDSGIFLDFFSGSATTAHAVMQLNAEDGGNRKFIMVQLPEPTAENSEAAKAGYKNICEIGKERIRRAGEKIKAEAEGKAVDLDIGFKVFKLDSSNLRK